MKVELGKQQLKLKEADKKASEMLEKLEIGSKKANEKKEKLMLLKLNVIKPLKLLIKKTASKELEAAMPYVKRLNQH